MDMIHSNDGADSRQSCSWIRYIVSALVLLGTLILVLVGVLFMKEGTILENQLPTTASPSTPSLPEQVTSVSTTTQPKTNLPESLPRSEFSKVKDISKTPPGLLIWEADDHEKMRNNSAYLPRTITYGSTTIHISLSDADPGEAGFPILIAYSTSTLRITREYEVTDGGQAPVCLLVHIEYQNDLEKKWEQLVTGKQGCDDEGGYKLYLYGDNLVLISWNTLRSMEGWLGVSTIDLVTNATSSIDSITGEVKQQDLTHRPDTFDDEFAPWLNSVVP